MSGADSLRINLGAGSDILAGWLNHDVVALPGIDCVHDLNVRPWPWASGSVAEIKAYDVLEHLDDFIPAMEEIWRILAPGGTCRISVPYWNSWCAAADPTHRRGFHEITFQFFDPSSPYCRSRPYYSPARFDILAEEFVLAPGNPYFSIPGVGEIFIRGRIPRRIVGIIGNYLISNLIQDLRLVLRKI
jgi:SAM-dependent methyltransferase